MGGLLDAATTSALILDNFTCLSGPVTHLTAALAALRASPLAPLHANDTLLSGTSCVQLNYTALAARPSCFLAKLYYNPKVMPSYFHHPADDANLIEAEERAGGLFTTFDFLHSLPNGTAQLHANCACFTGSDVCNALSNGACTAVPGHQCNKTVTPNVAPVVIEPTTVAASPAASPAAMKDTATLGSHVPDSGLLCNQGPIDFLRRVMVSRLKDGSLASLHQLDGVQPLTCAERGFPTELITPGQPHNGTDDHCFPPATIWFTSVEAGGLFDLESMIWVEDGAVAEYDDARDVPPGTGHRIAACKCLPNSTLHKSLPKGYCDGGPVEAPARRMHVSVPW